MPAIPELEEIRRAQILEAALRTISARGCADVTMEDIAQAAGLSKGGLAHYFKSKNDLFQATFKEFFDRVFLRVKDELTARPGGPMEKLLGFEMLFNRDDPDVALGYPLLFDCMSLAARDDTYRALFDEWVNNWITVLKGIIEDGIAQGVFQGLEPEATARAVSAIYQGIATRWCLAPGAHSREWALESVRRSVTGLLAPHRVLAGQEG